MQSARLRTRITIQRPVVSSLDAMGGDVQGTPTDLGSFWAEITALKGHELESMQQRWAEARFAVKMRHQPGITFQRKDQVAWGSRTLDILDVEDPDQRKRELSLICREIVA